MLWKQSERDYIVSEPDGSVMCTDTTDVGRIFDGRLTYSKGAYVLHMLRWVLGDSLFFQGMKDYLLDPSLSYNYAKTPDLQQHLETVSGMNLTTFFDLLKVKAFTLPQFVNPVRQFQNFPDSNDRILNRKVFRGTSPNDNTLHKTGGGALLL